MGYDIGIGLCISTDAAGVAVKLDSAMVSKLVPGRGWKRSGTSLLRFAPAVLSDHRPPRVGEEIYLARESIADHPDAELDLEGDGHPVPVDLRRLLDGLNPETKPQTPVNRNKR